MDIFDEIYFESLDSNQPLSPPTPVISSVHTANITAASSHNFVQPTEVRAAAGSLASSLAASAPSFATASAATPHRFAELHTLSQNLRLDSGIVSQLISAGMPSDNVSGTLPHQLSHFAGSGVLTHCAAAKSWCIENLYDTVSIETLEFWKSPKVDAGSCDATLQHAHSFVTISSDSEDSGTDNDRFASTDFSHQRIEERNNRAKVVIIDGDSSCESISAATPCPYHCAHQPHLIKCCSNSPLVPCDLLLKAIHEDHSPESEHLDAVVSAQAPPDSTAATASPDDSFVYAQRPLQDEPPDSSSVAEEILSCLMPFCETYGRVLRLDCGHTFCTSCLESQRLAKPKKKRSHHRPNRNRSKAMRAKAHVRMKCALCVRPFKMSLLELSAQPSSAVPRVSTSVGLPVEGGGRQVARPPEAQAASSSCAYNSAASWNRWDLCWAKLGEWPYWPAYIHRVWKSHVEVVFYDQKSNARVEKTDIYFKGRDKGAVFPYAHYRNVYVPPQNPEDATPRFFAAVRLADSDSRNGAAAVKRRYQKRIRDEPSSTNKRIAAPEQKNSRKKTKLPTHEAVHHFLKYTSHFSEEDKQQMWPGGMSTNLRGKCSGCNMMVRSVCCCSRTTWLCGKSCFSQHVASALFVDDGK